MTAVKLLMLVIMRICCHCREKTSGARKDILLVEDRADLLKGLGHIEPYVGHLVIGHFENHWQHLLGGDFLTTCF